MRVIAGSARSVPLRIPRGIDVRPTTDRIKETLFNIIQQDVPDSVFVDICAGSGAIGIEALSRGAAEAVFIDRERDAIETVRYNLCKCRLFDRARLVRADMLRAESIIAGLDTDKKLIIFMDPPYGKGLEYELLLRLSGTGRITPDTIIIAEQALDEPESGFDGTGFDIAKIKKYKTQKHVFLRRGLG